jgi:predicted phosphodiesterase
MQTVKVDLPRNYSTVKIQIGADWHIGDAFCKMNEVMEQINDVRENPATYIILNGDLMNNATKTSVSDCYAEQVTPMKQLETAVELLSPIKDKILLMTSGNHEDRTWKDDGVDLSGLIARELGIYDRYTRTSAVLFLKVGNGNPHQHNRQMSYSIFVNHGSGGGRKEGAKAIRLADMASIVDTDIYIHSHTHLPMIMRQGYHRVYIANQSVELVDKLFVNTASKLAYGGYGEKYEFKASSTKMPVIYLSGDKKGMEAVL